MDGATSGSLPEKGGIDAARDRLGGSKQRGSTEENIRGFEHEHRKKQSAVTDGCRRAQRRGRLRADGNEVSVGRSMGSFERADGVDVSQ